MLIDDLQKTMIDTLDEKIKHSTGQKRSMWVRYKKLTEMRCGFNSEKRVYSVKECAKYMDVTPSRIYTMEHYVFRYFRQYHHIYLKKSREEGWSLC